AAVAHTLSLATRAIGLEGLEVTAETRRCTVRPGDDALAVARVWDEARKALSAAALTDQRGVYRYETVTYTRRLDARTRVVFDQEESRREAWARRPFESRPAEDLVARGFVQRDGRDWVFYAPDASVLLSDAFLDTHCFRLAEGEPGLIGLAFEPTRDRGNATDIQGTLWLDAVDAELRWLEFDYWNLPDFPPSDAGGRVEFQRMPSGAWIVPEWWIRMPLVTPERGRPVVSGYRESGGRVLAAREAGGRELARRTDTGGIEGLVVDSAGSPAQGAAVRVSGSRQTVFTNAEGRFGVTGLAEGVYQLEIVGPGLEAYGYTPEPVTRGVVPGEMSQVEIHLPSVAEVLAEACRDREGLGGTAALVGAVVDAAAAEAPLPGATVRLDGSAVEGGAAGLREVRMRAETAADANGRWRFCGVPTGVTLAVSAASGDRASQPEEVRISAGCAGAAQVIRVD
ncbi:MAG TPA: carboxypeptidase-like regulatory domain-containing protein, partial [Longimicrobiales bacterium]|nr:carboxypeptidase-like regulatory domain-containing protein [Longimicrobiales bacterium]